MRTVESFENFIAEFYVSASPGSVVVPGEWYKDNVNSVNYVDKKQPMPMIVDTMFETNDVYTYLDELTSHKDFNDLLSDKSKGSKHVIEFIKRWLDEKKVSAK